MVYSPMNTPSKTVQGSTEHIKLNECTAGWEGSTVWARRALKHISLVFSPTEKQKQDLVTSLQLQA